MQSIKQTAPNSEFPPHAVDMPPKSEADSLPCLYSNNSITPPDFSSNRLSSSQKKSAIALAWNVQYMAQKHGLKNLGFLTLTFAEFITDMREAQRRFNSLNTNVLKTRYDGLIAVKERCKSGRIHFHLIVALKADIRSEFDFKGIEKHDYSSANDYLRGEWRFWRNTAKSYGFGRTELLPIKSTDEGIARYVGKYISKNVQQRPDEDKGFRLVNYGGDSKNSTTRFSIVNQGSKNWRHKVGLFSNDIARLQGLPPLNMNNISKYLGKRWAYKWREFILDYYPDLPSELPEQKELTPQAENTPPS